MSEWQVIGLTGPTGAGKSTVCQALARAGYGIVDTDRLAREVVRPGSDCLRRLVEAFSPAILQADGSLDRRELARRAFAAPEQTRLLNDITHPAIVALCEAQLARFQEEGRRGAVIDAPLLFESGLSARCHRVVAVVAAPEVRLRRLRQRDGLPEEELRRRMAAQPDESAYTERADTVLRNDGDETALLRQVRETLLKGDET